MAGRRKELIAQRADQMRTIVILAGGKSRRMGEDKVFLGYQNTSFLEYLVNRASAVFDRVLISAGSEKHASLITQRMAGSDDCSAFGQFSDAREHNRFPIPEIIIDSIPDLGPIGGLMSVFEQTDLERFAVIAADMPEADMQVLAELLDRLEQEYANRSKLKSKSTDQKGSAEGSCILIKPAVMLKLHSDYPEPSAAANERRTYPIMKAACDKGIRSIVLALGPGRIETITADELKRSGPAFAESDLIHAFRNINTPDDYRSLLS